MTHGIALCIVLSSGACASTARLDRCREDASRSCACPDGTSSTETCSEGRWSCACELDAGSCADGERRECACVDGRSGSQTCEGGAYGACLCDADAPRCVRHEERCDGTDHDCDGAVDEAWACVDDHMYVPAQAVVGRVWLIVQDTIRPILPDVGAPRVLTGVPSNPVFRPSDGVLFYVSGYDSTIGPTLYRDEVSSSTRVLTPPCDFGGRPSFDALDRMYYWCVGPIWRDHLVASGPSDGLVGVLASGRPISRAADALVLYDESAHEVTRYIPPSSLGGEVFASSAWVQGDRAWVTLVRPRRHEDGAWDVPDVFIMTVDADGSWRFMRRVRTQLGLPLGLPDGSILGIGSGGGADPCYVDRLAPGSSSSERLWSTDPGCGNIGLFQGP